MPSHTNIAVLGAGPLGTLIAAQLKRGGGNVTLVKRRVEAASVRFRVEPALLGKAFVVELPCTSHVPVGVDVVVVAVRAEQLDDGLLSLLKAVRAKAVLVFSPLLGSTLAAWRRELSGLSIGMPVLAAEFGSSNKNELHYWQVPSTVIERSAHQPQIDATVSILRKGGAWINWVADAEARCVANTVALFPFHVAVFRLPRLRDWLSDAALRGELARALSRSLRLGRQLGPVDPALGFLVWWLSSPVRMSFALRLAGAVAPRVCAFVERHFGAKLGRQHAVLANEVQRLADARAMAQPLCAQWMAELQGVGLQ